MTPFIPCPECGWQEINGNFVKYEERGMHFKLRCTRCNWLGDLWFKVELTTERKGSKNYA